MKWALDTHDGNNKRRIGASLEPAITNLELRWCGFRYPLEFLTTLRSVMQLHIQEWEDSSETQRKQIMLAFVKEAIVPRLVDKDGKHLQNIVAKELESLIKENKIKDIIPRDPTHKFLAAAEDATDIYSFIAYRTGDIVAHWEKYRNDVHQYCDALKPPKNAGNKPQSSDDGNSNGGNPNPRPQQKPNNKNTNSDSTAKYDNKRGPCTHCGMTNHASKHCYLRDYHPDANKANCPWDQSVGYKAFELNKTWPRPDRKVLPGDMTSDGKPWRRPEACNALMKEAQAKAAKGKQITDLSQKVITDDIFLSVDVIINDIHRQEGALMDFGAISGNHINVDLHDW